METTQEDSLVQQGFMLLRAGKNKDGFCIEVKDSIGDWRFYAPILSKKSLSLALKVFSNLNHVKIIKNETIG